MKKIKEWYKILEWRCPYCKHENVGEDDVYLWCENCKKKCKLT